MTDSDLSERIAFGELQQALLIETLMTSAAAYARENYFDRTEFILARHSTRPDAFEPWFEICLPGGTHLRVSVELRPFVEDAAQ